MIKFNPFTGNFDFVGGGSGGSDNFSYLEIPDSVTLTIPEGQQMIVNGHVKVEGHLQVSGEMVDISGRVGQDTFFTEIDSFKIEEKRLLLYKQHLLVNDHLRINGDMREC